ncbi:tetratricopeptide repeat protein [Pseudoflavitalea sp. G-6-1-2]|uniref:tetratricopeptide repeat protein n=1 Tax=Pseudoflavitalea sp. G-6-1-2 TaxID=2728841 RepID=UPI00146E094B|nr:tetratricopeptide repeat protein [Pseudoflavitalea sp. G-6-1-2]NML21250.1 tetratricopeptide repeat protein [Pseudoflavitalea sp. G-6-1-2]
MEGNFIEAKRTANDVLQTDGNNVLAYVVRASGNVYEYKLTAAQADIEKAAKLQPESGVVQGFLSNIHSNLGNEALSKKAAEKALTLLGSPNTAIEYYARGYANFAVLRDDQAIEDFTKSFQLNPRYLRALAFRASLYKAKNQTDLAFNDYTRCIQTNPGYAIPYVHRGKIYMNRGNNELAIADFMKAVQVDPLNDDAWINTNYAFCSMRQYDKALECLNKAEAINPNNAWLNYQRGNIYFDLGKLDDALSYYNQYQNKAPKSALSYIQKAKIYKAQGKLEEALGELTLAFKLDSKNADTWLERGNLFFEAQMWDDAVLDYQEAAKLNPNLASAQLNIGCVKYQLEFFNEALTYFNRAIELNPNYALAYINRADTYDALGKTKEANADKKKYVELGGQLAPAGAKTIKDIYPSTNFDANLTRAALQRGSSVIKGRACTKADGLKFDASGITVVLYPATPYLEEWYELREKKEGKKTRVYMSKEAVKFCVTAQCDRDGRFAFEGLKPGRYFIQIMHNFNQQKTGTRYVGSSGRTDYYSEYNYTIARSARLEKFVEIKEDGDTKRITLSNSLIKSCSGIL